MKTIHTYRAESFQPDRPIEPLTIIVDRAIPTCRNGHGINEIQAAFVRDA